MAGEWKIEVVASEINQDARPETPTVDDVDFALVASGILPLAPTAANVTVSGRVTEPNGSGIRGARITLTDDEGVERPAQTNSFGYFSFADVPGGANYVVSVASRKYVFDPSSMVIAADDDVIDIAFVSAE